MKKTNRIKLKFLIKGSSLGQENKFSLELSRKMMLDRYHNLNSEIK